MGKCCVEGCIEASSKDITYFNFPASRSLRRKWIAAISPELKPKLSSMVCSRHFLSEDCESARGRTRLRPGAVPSIFNQKNHASNDSNSSDSMPLKDIQQNTKSTSNTENPMPNDKVEEKNKDTKHNKETVDINKEDKNDTVKLKKDDSEKKNDLDESKGLKDKSENLQNKNEDLHKESDSLQDKSEDLQDKSEDFKDKSENKQDEIGNLQDKVKGLGDESEIDTELKRPESCEERVQDNNSEKKEESLGEKEMENKSGNSSDRQDKCAESSPQLPDGPRDIDKQPQDIEDLLTNYHIKQTRPLNIHSVTDEPETIEVEIEQEPVFIEISVDKDTAAGSEDKNDCLMVLERLEVELDPSELMLPDRDLDLDMDTVEIHDAPDEKEDPISLLTSSDEDDVIIEEPHIDTVEVSDETDEDDVPLLKLLKRRRANRKNELQAQLPPANGEADIAKILWGMYEYYCVQCHYTTSSGTEYRRHTASHAKVLMMCQICSYMTASETQFTKHEKQHGEKKYKCHLCSYKAKHNMSLLYHLKGHKAEDFIKSANLSALKKVKATGRVFECNSCSYTTKKRCDLKRHTSRRHKKDNDDNDEDFVP